MSGIVETVIVTAAAALALFVLVRPLLPGREPRVPPRKSGCSACESPERARQ